MSRHPRPCRAVMLRLMMAPPLTYEQFRTGLTFGAVRGMLFGRPYRRRRTVLGYWRQLKQEMYREYLRQWEASRVPF